MSDKGTSRACALVAGFCGLWLASAATAQAPDDVPDVGIPVSVVPRPLAVAPRAAPDAQGNYRVDVLVLYTALAEPRRRGDTPMRPYAARLIAASNRYFANSLMPVRYRLVGVERTEATSERADYASNQADLAASAAVRERRNRVGADLVVLLRANDASNGCGLGGLFNGGEQTDPPANVDPERDAFAVVGAAPSDDGVSCIDVEHTFAHELGHCMGGGHQNPAFSGVHIREGNNVYIGSYWKPYAHASYCGFTSNGLRNNTIMMGGVGQANGPYVQGGDLRGDYFSNPALTVDGAPCGTYLAGLTEVEADNARSISEAAPYVAAYRASADARAEGSGMAAGSLPPSLAMLALAVLAARRRRR